MSPTRRQFMKTSGAWLGAAGLGAVPARWLYGSPEAAEQPPTLISLYLRGGADPLSVIVPYRDKRYYRIRPTIAVPPQRQGDSPGVIRLANDKRFGLHPAMTELAELYAAGMMAAIVNVGSTHPTRSHFDAQDFMERAAPGIKAINEGWLNRYLGATGSSGDSELRAVSLQPVLPRSLRGQYPVLAVPQYGATRAMNVFGTLYGCSSEKQAIELMQQDKPPKVSGVIEPADAESVMRQRIITAGAQGIRKLRRLNSIVHGIDARQRYPRSHLAHQFRGLAKIIKANVGLEIAALDYNGWDHHAYQGGPRGTMADMLTVVSQAIKAFCDDLGPRMNKVVILVMSEFGRTVKENGNNGSDHGHGGFMLAVGGPVAGGKVYGKWTGLDPAVLYQGRDMPVYTDFRSVFGETLAGLFGFHADQQDFFPEFKSQARPMGIIKSSA